MPDLEGALVEVARTRPEPIGARAITRSIHPVAPDTLAEINLLAFFNHLWVRLGRVGPFDKSRRQPAIGLYIAGRPQNGDVKADSGLSPGFIKRSEEHTSELQSLAYLVCRLLLEKKKKKINVQMLH